MKFTTLMRRQRRSTSDRRTRDRGVTLIEIVITITLMGVIVVPILVAVATSVRSSRVSEDSAQVETLLVNAVDRVNRATRGDFPCDLTSPVVAAVETVGWPASSVNVGHEYLDIDEQWQTDPTGTACPGGSFQTGIVQRITITITSPDEGITRSLQVIRGDI
ncbi:MAG: prepilin-type N-terminal cleavage/methylation domain-containing protein [Ilumatobacteraceae bacterium]|nr:prepilin-type N-terminal cleavage/methylation domain-containing protein [Ilumatobacteraceae bacterium]